MNCLICNSSNIKVYESRTGDFLSARIFEDKKSIDINLMHCLDCGFSFYDYRLSNDELALLYKGYRNSDYQKQRQQYDCWYTKEINDIIGKNDKEIECKKKTLLRILNSYVNLNTIKTVLDYGGDKGQNIPDIPNVKKYLFDISCVEPVEDVIVIKDLKKTQQYNLVISEECLEHVSDPMENIKMLKSLISQEGYLYIEVPCEDPFNNSSIFNNLSFLFSKYFSWKNIIKHFIKLKKEKKFKPMCEHQNYFTKKSLEILLQKNGFKILYLEEEKMNLGWRKSKNIFALAK